MGRIIVDADASPPTSSLFLLSCARRLSRRRLLQHSRVYWSSIVPPIGSATKIAGRLVCQRSILPHHTEHSAFLYQPCCLYSFSLPALSPSELTEQRPFHLSPSRCSNVLVPRPSAVCAFIIRAMTRLAHYCPTQIVLDSDLGELVLYFFRILPRLHLPFCSRERKRNGNGKTKTGELLLLLVS
ncbi:hypothetical protein K503DRAFT_396030 [Rhizopogon vinicolor AM-OR11-026]|uniref:Uncharacterized protein n=1 Tax=Rhizopogon vinicolor AM-OR11-026 TaxID=1314800 RepID=A0A1B7NBE6_9AGAM|nr:hypothetical protein K503DRAFT_396030 [Rhizopogon vinicolor AM-OR11-026]